jgi:glycosyltransferase involved in cell wall biosynthesis
MINSPDCGGESSTEILGTVTDERLVEDLGEAQLFTLPCRIAGDGDRDAGPTVLKQAMATETACVSTTISGIQEIIVSGESGLLVDPDNPGALVDALRDLLTDDRLHPTERPWLGEPCDPGVPHECPHTGRVHVERVALGLWVERQ